MLEVDRIYLCVVMGRDPGFFAPNHDTPIFDPANDANQDYQVLEWMRENEDFWEFEVQLDCFAWRHVTGNYAKIAIKVLRSIEDSRSEIENAS